MNPVDLVTGSQLKKVLQPQQSSGDNTARVGAIIDHQGYEGALYGILVGTMADADATFTVLLDEGDVSNLSDAAAVGDGDMVSQVSGTAPETAAAFQFDDDGEVRKLGYKGVKRYTRLTITPASNTGTFAVAAFCLLLGARKAPVTQAAS